MLNLALRTVAGGVGVAQTLMESVATILRGEGRVGLVGLRVCPQSFAEEKQGK